MRTEPSFSAEPEEPDLDGLTGSTDHYLSASDAAADSKLLSDYRQHFGLSSEPFADDAHFPFYTGGQRRQILDQLLHLCQFSNNLLLVLGDYSVGKTRMAQALIDALDDADDICFLEGQINSSYDRLFAEVLEQFELADAQAFADFTELSPEYPGLAVVLVDNAHHLTDAVILDLIALIQSGKSPRLHLVLFAEPHLLGRIENLNVPDVILSDFYLEKFSLVEAVDYLNFRMEMADYLGPEIFTEAKVEPWWRESQGQLLVLHDYAHEKLLASVAVPRASGFDHKKLPMFHIMAATVLIAGLIMGFLYLGSSSKEPGQVTNAVVLPKPLPDATPVDTPVASAAPQAATGVVSSVGVASSLPATSDVNGSPAAVPKASVAAVAQAAPQQEVPVVKQSVVPLAQASAPHSELAASAKSSRISSVAAVKESKPVEAVPEPVKKAAKPAEEVHPEKAKHLAGYSEQENTILSWSDAEFTLQLVGLSSEKAVHEFIAAQPNKKDLLVFKSLRQGKDWFVVVTGRYPSSAKARQAIQLLPESQKKAAPWPREIKVIQREIKQR